MIAVKAFAQVREISGEEHCSLAIDTPATMSDVKSVLSQRSTQWQVALSGEVLMACNQQLVNAEHLVNDGDEVAFFPPVTGG